MISFEWDRWGYGQSYWPLRSTAELVKYRVVKIRTNLQPALNRTKRNIDTFAKLQKSEAQYSQYQRHIRSFDLKNDIENLLFELDTDEWWRDMLDLKNDIKKLLFELDTDEWRRDMSALKSIIECLLLELSYTFFDMSESDKGAMRIELDQSKSELDALEKDRNAMQEALKQTRRDIFDVAKGRETMLLAQKEMAIVTLANLKKDKEILQDAIHAKSSSMGFLLLPFWTFFSRSITSYMEEDIDVLREELRRKEKAIAILKNYIAVLQFEIRPRMDMSGWSARYIVTSDYMQTYVKVEDLETSGIELDRSRWLHMSCPAASLQTTRDLYGHTFPAKVFSFQTALLGEFANSFDNCTKFENYSILAPFQTRGGTDELLKDTEDVRVKLDRKRRLQSELERKTEDMLDASYQTTRDIVELGKDTTAVRFKLYQIRMDMTAGGAQAVCAGIVVAADGVQAVYAGMVIDSVLRYHIIKEEMEIRVNTIHVTFGGKPTSKDVQSYKTSVSFGDMSAEVLERQNFEKQSEEEEKEEEEEFRAVEEMLMCKVCLDEDLCIIFLPCSHLATCERCASVLHSCPVCRSPINESLKVNFE